MELTEKQTSEELRLKNCYSFWADQAGLVFLRTPDTSEHGWEDGLHVSHGLSRSTAERLHDELSKILNRTPDPRMVEVLENSRATFEQLSRIGFGHPSESLVFIVTGMIPEYCNQAIKKIDALLKGEKPTEPFKEG